MAGNAREPGTTVTQRIVSILDAFDVRHRELPLARLAERSGLAPATTHRLAAELVAGGLLERRDDGRYAVGRRMWDLGLLASVQTDLRAAASPFLQDIYAATLATVHLAVREGTEVLYVERLSGRASVPIISTVGTRLPAHATGVGKVLLAHAPSAVLDELFASPLRRLTPYTVVQPGTLRRQLEAARRDGCASTVEEVSAGACSLAVPVRRGTAPEAPVVAALGVVVPSLKRDRTRLLASLRTATAGIARSW